MKVVVCGGRDFDDVTALRTALDRAHDRMIAETGQGFTLIVEGGARGADTLAREWARGRGIPVETVMADWTEGRAAGPLRNAKMLQRKPDLVIVFPGGRGTANMIAQARRWGVPLLEILPATPVSPSVPPADSAGGET